MNFELKVTLSADPALLAAILALAGAKAPAQTSTPAPTKAKATKAQEQAAPALAEAGTADTGVSAQSQNGIVKPSEVSTAHTLESLRAIAVPKSKAGKKDEIRAKLAELGYPGGLNELQPKDFEAFYQYITAL